MRHLGGKTPIIVFQVFHTMVYDQRQGLGALPDFQCVRNVTLQDKIIFGKRTACCFVFKQANLGKNNFSQFYT